MPMRHLTFVLQIIHLIKKSIMKKAAIKILLPALPAVLMVACKPTLKVSTDYDRSANFSQYKTFSLYYLITNRNVSELNEERIWNSIRAEMIKKGYQENNRNPDLVVNAMSVLKNRKTVSANSNVYGYGGAYRPYRYWSGGMATGTTTFQTGHYKEGSLVIEVVDAHKNRLVWQGTGNAEFEKQPKNPDLAISNAVNKILAKFPQGDATAKH
jgi:hypothetical protein